MGKKLLRSPLFYFLIFLSIVNHQQVLGQSQTISGIVIDENGHPLAAASVLVKSGKSGAASNDAGHFIIRAALGDTLVFHFIGYQEKEIILKTTAALTVTLVSEKKSLTDVVVVAYGAQSTKEITGAVQSITAGELQDQPAAQFTQKLQGKLAGVQITQATGTPGSGMVVRIRGAASISAGNSPLYVVDGFPITGDISNINPDEIESLSVLKDASSTSLYGSRAANGVVIVTTKKAKAGATTVALNSYYGVQSVAQKGRPNMMNAQEFATFKKELADDNGQTVDPLFQDPSKYGKGTDWYGAVLRTAPIGNYSLAVNSSKDKFNTSLVLGYFDQDGVMRNSYYNRYSLRANLDYKPLSFLKIGANIAPSFYRTNQPQTDGIWYNTAGIVEGAILTSPLAPYKNADGTIPVNSSGYGTLDAPNWYNMLYAVKNNTKNSRILGNVYAEAYPIQGLTLKTSINADYSQSVYNNFTPSTAGGFFNPGSETDASRIHATVSNGINYSWLWENTANYKRSFGSHNLELLAGITSQYYRIETSSINATKFPDNLVQTINAAGSFSATGSMEEWALLSYVGRLNYNFEHKYLLSAAIRRDGSSRFGMDNRYGNFPSISAGWAVSEESFMQPIKLISNLKLRASYGTVGNNNIGNYTQYATVVGTNYVYNDGLANGRSLSGLNNTKLGWETSKEADLGLDISVLNNRISFSYDYYHKITENLLYSVDIPISSGFFNYTTNIGQLKFYGHEFLVSTQNLVGKLKWSTDLNIAFNRNQVQALGTANASIYGDLTITQVGRPIGLLYGYVFDGVYKDQGDYEKSAKYAAAEVGMAKFRDVNKDGVVTFDNNDKAILGNPTPKFVYGMTNRLAYDNFDLTIVIAGQYGNKLANRIEQFTENLDGAFNVTKDLAYRWRSASSPGNGRYGKDISGTTSYERDNASSRMIYDASFLTVKNITIGYGFDLKKTRALKSIRLYLSGQQLWVFTKYPGGNPEATSDANGNQPSALNLGSDYSAYPVPRTITIGANINF